MSNEKRECCICNRTFHGMGNNPHPFHGERCCEECDDRFVIPCRMLLTEGTLNHKLEIFLKALAKYGLHMIDIKRKVHKKRLIAISGGKQ